MDLSKFPGSSCWFSRGFESAGWQVRSEDGIHEAPDSVDKTSSKMWLEYVLMDVDLLMV